MLGKLRESDELESYKVPTHRKHPLALRPTKVRAALSWALMLMLDYRVLCH